MSVLVRNIFQKLASGIGASLVGFDGGTMAGFFLSKNNRVVDSLAALQALDPTVYTRAFVTGFAGAGDGGGGPYRYDGTDSATAVNGGTIVASSDGKRWKHTAPALVSCLTFGVLPNGADQSANLVNYAASMPASGGVLYFPANASAYVINSWPSLAGKVGLTIRGDGGVSAGAGTPTKISIGATGSGNWISAPGSVGLRIEDIQFSYASSSFTGWIVALGNNGSDSAFARIRRCGFFGSGSTLWTASGINCDKTIEWSIEGCVFSGLTVAIGGYTTAGSYSNVGKIERCQFSNTRYAPINGGGQAWRVIGNTFEGFNNGTAGSAMAGSMGMSSPAIQQGLAYEGNWHGDVSTAGGTWVTVFGGAVDIGKNWFGGNAGSDAIAVYSVAGLRVVSNHFDKFSAALSFGDANCANVEYHSNEYNNVTNRVGNQANWGGYASGPYYETLLNGKIRIYGKVSVTAGTGQAVAFGVTLAAAPESIKVSLSGPAGSSSTAYTTAETTTGMTLNTGGPAGASMVYWEVTGTLPG